MTTYLNIIQIVSSVYLFAFVIQMILLGFKYDDLIHPVITKAIMVIHATLLMLSIFAIVLDQFRNPYFITFIVSLIGFVLAVSNEKGGYDERGNG